MEDLMKVAQSLNGANLQDGKTIRGLVQQLSQMTGKRVPKQLEEKIVETLVKNKQQIDPNTISKMMNKMK
jgi:hypothetical protein